MANVKVTTLQDEYYDDYVNCEKCKLKKHIDEVYPSDSGDYVCDKCLNDLYDYSAE